MADAPALELRDLTLKFGGLTVLESVSLSVQQGELLALIGPNGAGKTSILNCITGLYRVHAGQVIFDRRNISKLPPHAIARMGIARTFQHAELFPTMSVLDNLLVGRHASVRSNVLSEGLFLRGVRREEVRHREAVEEIIDFVGLERYRHRPVGSLPFGVQKVVGFARALANEPKILLLDEPCAGLNRDDREDMARHIMRIQNEKRLSMVWVEHDMQMVADLADRLYVLNHGKLLAQGDPATVLNDPKVIEAYIGHSTPTEALASIDREHDIETTLLRTAVDAISSTQDKQAVADIFDRIAEYNKAHFSAEELQMRLYGYPELDAHASDHASMVADLKAIIDCLDHDDRELAGELATQLLDDLLRHIAGRDHKFSRYLDSLAVADSPS